MKEERKDSEGNEELKNSEKSISNEVLENKAEAEDKQALLDKENSANKEGSEKKKFHVTFIKILSDFFSIILVVFLVFIVYSAIIGWGGNGISVGPFQIFNVISGSMQPSINVGDIVLTQSVSKDELHVADVVTYRQSEDSKTFVTHRIVSVLDEQDSFITRGDANNTDDKPVHFNNIIGKVVFRLPLLGFLISMSSTPSGLILMVIVFALFIVLIEIIKRIIKS